jgi:leucyl aminopeptidase
LALALLVIKAQLPVRLRLLLPIAENSISGQALRPGDVIRARNGKTTEITNTDAEGRLLLADALAAAVEINPSLELELGLVSTIGSNPSLDSISKIDIKPEASHYPWLVVDFATLTGAARVALGQELPALFSNNKQAQQKLWDLSMRVGDPMWPLPLWEPMRTNLKSGIADLVNAVDG